MTLVAIGSTDQIIEGLFNLPRYDQHVKDWRWWAYTRYSWADTYGLHVLDFYLSRATKELRK